MTTGGDPPPPAAAGSGDPALDRDAGPAVGDAAPAVPLHRLLERLDGLERTLAAVPAQVWRATERATGDLADGAGALGRSVTLPAWRRQTAGESRWPVAAAIAAAVVLQALLPPHLSLRPRWLLPTLEALLLAAILVSNPTRIDQDRRGLRQLGLALVAAMSIANGVSALLLADRLVHGRAGQDALPLLLSGSSIYLTNVIAFALWYWEFDRGGPLARARGRRQHPDFGFPQMMTPEIASPDWEPLFADYLYVSFTNATAFSPTDTMPLSRWAKALMAVQSTIALVTVALVVARAVNILK